MVKAATDHRERLLEGLTDSLGRKPYREVTLTDITAAARVSRRTFYQHFANKDECLLALAANTSVRMMRVVLTAVQNSSDWQETVERVTDAYLSFIHSQPPLMKALYIETSSMGLEGLKARRQIAETFAAFLVQQVDDRRRHGESLQAIDQNCAIVMVAGINELILHTLIDDRAHTLMELAPVAVGIINRFVMPPAR